MASPSSPKSPGTGNLMKDAVIEATYQAVKEQEMKNLELDNMDALNLGNNDDIKQLIKVEGLQNEKVVFSDKISKVNAKGKKQDRYLMITDKAVYNLKPKKYKESQRRVPIERIGMMTLSSSSPEFAIHVTQEYDYHFISKKNQEKIAEVLQYLYHQETDKKMLIVYSPLQSLKDVIVTKKLAKYEDENIKMGMEIAVSNRALLT